MTPTARAPVLGLVVNPIAGIGGAVGLKGSDGAETVARALALGAVPHANERAADALARLAARWPAGRPRPQVLTGAGVMGASAAIRAGLEPEIVGRRATDRTGDPASTTADDTRRIVAALAAAGVDLILFAGGDGTARDVAAALAGTRVPVLGIPAGVKIHSAVFATSPATAGDLAAAFLALAPGRRHVVDREIVDIDEAAYRRGEMAPRLFGELPVPTGDGRVQARKEPTPASDAAATAAIAADLADSLEAGVRYVLGPGSTVRAIADRLGVAKTLVGVDVVELDADRVCRVVAADARGSDVDTLVADGGPVAIVVTPIGGQGFLFGRGNQQIGASVIARALSTAGHDGIVVVATPAKLAALGGRPLLVDTGDPAVDALLDGHVRIVTGHRERTIYPVRPAWESLR
jgi:predicted polyphosphate/ATP-dependent NAD kinase